MQKRIGTFRRFLWVSFAAFLLASVAQVLRLGEQRRTPEWLRAEAVGNTEISRDGHIPGAVGLAPIHLGAARHGSRTAAAGLAEFVGAVSMALDEETRPQERWLRGHVRLPSGEPAQNSLVALMEMRSGAPVSSGRNAEAVTDEFGAFELAVPVWAWGQTVHLSARSRGWRPFSKVVVLEEAQIRERHDLRLGEGFAIEGRVLRDDLPVPNVHVSIDVAYGTPGIHGIGREMWWAEDRMEEKSGEARTDANGRFRVAGLSAGAQRVCLHEPQASTSRVGVHVLTVEAPDDRDYEVSSGTIAVLVMGSTGPLDGARIVGSATHGRATTISRKEPVKLEFPPGKTVRLVVEHPLALGVERDVVVPAAGQTSDVHVGMQMLHRPRLYVTVEGGEDAMLPSISLRFSGLSGQGGATLIAKRGDGPQAFVVDEVALAPASYFVSPEPGCLGSRQSYLLPAVQQIEVPAAGEFHLRLPLAIGGRFETRLLSPAEKPWSGSLRLVDAAGRTCMERSIYHLPNGQRYEFDLDLALDADRIPEEEEFAIDSGITAPPSFDTTDAVGDIAAEALEARRLSHQQRQEDDHGVFPAGVYTLMMTSDGYADWSQTIELSAGETTAVHASLGR